MLISLTIFSFYYNETYNPDYVNSLKTQTLVVVRTEKLALPLIFIFLRLLLIISFFTTFVYFLYKILSKLGMNNIYFDKIKSWTIAIFILIVAMLIMYLPFPALKDNLILGFYISSIF